MTVARYNKSGEFFISGSTDKKLFLYEGKDCNELKELVSPNGHTRTITAADWFDDHNFATSSNDTTVKVWNINDNENLKKTLKVS